ncbi:MAG: hypothetical protein U1E30_04640 [Rhodoblastus sp.]
MASAANSPFGAAAHAEGRSSTTSSRKPCRDRRSNRRAVGGAIVHHQFAAAHRYEAKVGDRQMRARGQIEEGAQRAVASRKMAEQRGFSSAFGATVVEERARPAGRERSLPRSARLRKWRARRRA